METTDKEIQEFIAYLDQKFKEQETKIDFRFKQFQQKVADNLDEVTRKLRVIANQTIQNDKI